MLHFFVADLDSKDEAKRVSAIVNEMMRSHALPLMFSRIASMDSSSKKVWLSLQQSRKRRCWWSYTRAIYIEGRGTIQLLANMLRHF